MEGSPIQPPKWGERIKLNQLGVLQSAHLLRELHWRTILSVFSQLFLHQSPNE